MRVLGLDWMFDDPKWKTVPDFDDVDQRTEFWETMLDGGARRRPPPSGRQVFDDEPDVWAEIFRHGSELLDHPQMRPRPRGRRPSTTRARARAPARARWCAWRPRPACVDRSRAAARRARRRDARRGRRRPRHAADTHDAPSAPTPTARRRSPA